MNNFIYTSYIDLNLCDELVAFHNKSNNKVKGLANKNNDGVVDELIKKSIDTNLTGDLHGKYCEALQKVAMEYIEKYPWCNQYSAWGIFENINIQQYEPNGGYYAWHTERCNANYPFNTRHLVFITYLNDVDDAGETEFYHQQIKIKPRKGLTVIFPADWTFTHRGIPSPTQEKYIVTGWYGFYNKE